MTSHFPVPVLDADDYRDLAQARTLLEHPGLATKIANAVGAPVEHLLRKRLPRVLSSRVEAISQRALRVALRSALSTLRTQAPAKARPRLHGAAVATTGAVGGFFGLPGFVVELPLTTTLMLRSIADIARAEGERLDDPATALACLEVLAHGGPRQDDDSESGYFAVRAALAQQLGAAAQYVAAHGLGSKGAPVLVSVLSRIAAKFSVTVSEKLAAQAVPLVGAASGALLNALFIAHFQALARGHFIVRRLERRYGEAAVRQAYEALPAQR
ncbi:EcsC family protein [Xanthomonas sp. MUS 060]|uniref:EcsC family protein n=1 Tax=Xanthomonas sp. MUS 060 TaxID=1588031 RepID=UPI000A5CDDF9|nr:EcsC family protein [Xanthomonas sp. MUS 060]